MRQYVALVVCWALAAHCFYNTYYGFRFPAKYIRAKWTVMRGLPIERESAKTGACITMVVGPFLLWFGLVILRDLLTQGGAALPTLP